MKVFDILPPASPRHGFLRTVSAWKDAALVEFGPEGTMNYAQMSIPGVYDNLFTTGMEESQIIFGDTDNLASCIREVDRNLHPRLLIVTSSPVSEIIGTDLRLVCLENQDEVGAELMIYDSVPMEEEEKSGRKSAFLLASRFLPRLPEMEKQGILVLGLDQTDYNGISDLNELRRMGEAYFSLSCRNDAYGRYSLRDLSQAELILTVDPAAEILAQEAQKLWGTPWCSGLCYGREQSEALVSRMASLLGRAPSKAYEEDRASAERVRRRFRSLQRTMLPSFLHLELEQHRGEALGAFLSRLGVSWDMPQDPRHGTWKKSDILLGSGVLCSLFPESPSFCMDYPGVRHSPIGEHCPYMGFRGEETLLMELSNILPTV